MGVLTSRTRSTLPVVGAALALLVSGVSGPALAGVGSYAKGSGSQASSIEPVLSWPDIGAFRLENGQGTIGVRVDKNAEHVDHVVFRFSRPVLAGARATTQVRVTESLQGDPFGAGEQGDYYVLAIDLLDSPAVKVETILVRSPEAASAAKRSWSFLSDSMTAKRVALGKGGYEDRAGGYTGPLYFWCRSGEQDIDLSNAPVSDDVVILYEHWFEHSPFYLRGKKIQAGIPQLTDLETHLASVREVVEEQIPDPAFDGYAVLDYEVLWPQWEMAQKEQRRDSLKLVRERRGRMNSKQAEALAKAEYEEASGELLLETLRLCKSLRPSAKWGFYGHMGIYYTNTRDVEMSEPLRQLIDEVDVLFPSVYARNFSVPDSRRPGKGQWKERDYEGKIDREIDMVAEFADGRPVIAFAWLLYHNTNDRYGRKPLNNRDLEIMLTQPFEAGADAVAIWGHAQDERDARRYQRLLKGKASKIMDAEIAERRAKGR